MDMIFQDIACEFFCIIFNYSILIHSSLVLIHQSSLSKRTGSVSVLVGILNAFLIVTWFVMLISTSLFFHSWSEKLLGSLLGAAFSFFLLKRERNILSF